MSILTLGEYMKKKDYINVFEQTNLVFDRCFICSFLSNFVVWAIVFILMLFPVFGLGLSFYAMCFLCVGYKKNNLDCNVDAVVRVKIVHVYYDEFENVVVLPNNIIYNTDSTFGNWVKDESNMCFYFDESVKNFRELIVINSISLLIMVQFHPKLHLMGVDNLGLLFSEFYLFFYSFFFQVILLLKLLDIP